MNTVTNLIDDLRLLEEPRLWPGWWWIGSFAVIIAIVILIRRSLSTGRGAGVRAEFRLPSEAQEDALLALEKARRLLSEENAKLYAIEVSSIIRRYLEQRFDIRAPQRSTEEFILEAQHSPKLDTRHRESLGTFLTNCDFLKFARGLAEFSELETVHQAAVEFVTETCLVVAGVPTDAPVRSPLIEKAAP